MRRPCSVALYSQEYYGHVHFTHEGDASGATAHYGTSHGSTMFPTRGKDFDYRGSLGMNGGTTSYIVAQVRIVVWYLLCVRCYSLSICGGRLLESHAILRFLQTFGYIPEFSDVSFLPAEQGRRIKLNGLTEANIKRTLSKPDVVPDGARALITTIYTFQVR